MNPLAVIVALTAAGLAGLVGYELLLPSAGDADRAPPVRVAGPSAAPVATASAVAPEAGVNDDILLARPLFSQTRRPPDVASPATASVGGTAPLPRMTGILIDGPNRRAIFAGGEGGKALTVAEGGQVGSFIVQSIGPQQVTLVGPDGPRTVRTTFDPALQAPSPLPGTLPGTGFVPPLFPGIAMPGMPVSPNSPSYSQPTRPAFDAGNGSPSGAAR